MPKGREVERSLNRRPARRATLFAATLAVVAGALASALGGRGDSICPVVAARFESVVAPALVVHVCMVVPYVGPALGLRYEVEVRITLVPATDDIASGEY